MSETHNFDQLESPVCKEDPKERECLRCQAAFKSEWAGERICTRCKSSNAWRSGLPVRATGSGGRR